MFSNQNPVIEDKSWWDGKEIRVSTSIALNDMGIHDEKIIFTSNIAADLLALGFTQDDVTRAKWSDYGANRCDLRHSNGNIYNYFHGNTRKHTLIRIA